MLFCLSLLATPLENQLSSGGDQTCSNWKTGQATSVYAVLATEGENVFCRALMMTGGMPTNPVTEGQSGGHTDPLYPTVITHLEHCLQSTAVFIHIK